MRAHRSHLTAILTGTAVLAPAVALLVTRGVVEALLMIGIVAVLAGMYMLRRYARAELLYRRRDEPRPAGEPAGHAPSVGRGT